MYSIFKPLDAHDRLPRELLLEGRRHRVLGRRELAGVLWLPALLLVLTLAGAQGMSGLMVMGILALMFIGFAVFALTDDRGRS
jgi:hypothetical protein